MVVLGEVVGMPSSDIQEIWQPADGTLVLFAELTVRPIRCDCERGTAQPCTKNANFR